MGYRVALPFLLCNCAAICTIFFFTYASEERPSSVSTLCHSNQSSALLQFKLGLDLRPGKLTSWQEGSDCCHWEGVSCDNRNGFVTALQLSNTTNRYDIAFSSVDPALFELQHLQLLNLSYNDFSYEIPKGLAQLPHIVHLDLSNCFFSGGIPLEMSQMAQLVSLNLSFNVALELRYPNLTKLVKGLSNLQDLRLDQVNISASGKDISVALSSSLPRMYTLSLMGCDIHGPMDESLAGLGSLSYLDLGWNDLNYIPEFFANLTSLRVLMLKGCSLQGNFPSGIFLLPLLEEVDVSFNELLVIHMPLDDTRLKSSRIQTLELSYTRQISSNIEAFSYLTQLAELRMKSTRIEGRLPSSWHSVGILYLDVSDNSLSGPIPECFNSLSNLTHLDLKSNLLGGSIPSPLLNHPNLFYIDLRHNRFNGSLPKFCKPLLNLQFLYLANNSLSGGITFTARELPNLQLLDLSLNLLSDTINISLFLGMKKLLSLDLSYNAELSVVMSNASKANQSNMINMPQFEYLYLSGCGIKTFPFFIQKLHNLHILDLSQNGISGRIPSWLWHRELQGFYISGNQIEGIDGPSNDTQLLDSSLVGLNVSGNRINERIPTFICNFTSLQVVDMSDNQLVGDIPNCFDNKFQRLGELGFEPEVQGLPLRMLNLNTNFLSGKIPKSLSNCSKLKALDLGNNQLNGTFPSWLGSLSNLLILTLRSNCLGGHITFERSQRIFPSLRILDIADNLFSGSLPSQLFTNLQAMKVLNSASAPTFIDNSIVSYLLGGTRYVSVTQRIKGNDVVVQKLIEALMIIDLSDNLFTGDVPKEIGELQGLYQLNMSSNNLSGTIPKSLGNMNQLEALDLSNNHLSGSIPVELSRLTFLAILNLSFNDLRGSIPQGNQFDTFDESSFKGNLKLCGAQVKKQCSVVVDSPPQQALDGDEEEVQMKYAATGIGFAVGLGILTLPILFIKRVGHWYWDQIDKITKCLIYSCYLIIYGRRYNQA